MNDTKKKHPQVYVTIYHPVAGYKAVLMDYDEGPIQTGYFAYATAEEARLEARMWAEAEEVPFLDGPSP